MKALRQLYRLTCSPNVEMQRTVMLVNRCDIRCPMASNVTLIFAVEKYEKLSFRISFDPDLIRTIMSR